MQKLKDYLALCEQRCQEYMKQYDTDCIKPDELKIGALEYFSRGGKRLRPALLSLSAGAMGGKDAEMAVTPAMVSVELFHTFTLVHDDIIDNDDTRRGGKSVHILIKDMMKSEEYGRDIAILAGDTLHALSVSMLLECAKSSLFSPETVIAVTRLLDSYCINELLAGEAVDTRMGVIKSDKFDVGNADLTLEVMTQKTGVLFEYSAMAGAMLGLNTPNTQDRNVRSLGEFAKLSGIAFQIKDDILGVVSDEKTLGKPIGSDIREGKKTLVLQEAYKNATDSERLLIEKTVGNDCASESDIDEVKGIFISKGVKKAEAVAEKYIQDAFRALEKINDSEYKLLLGQMSEFMMLRKK